MAQQWKVRVRGKQSAQADIALLIQAVLALGEQLQAETADLAADRLAASGEEQAAADDPESAA
jgi:hypothetical protein